MRGLLERLRDAWNSARRRDRAQISEAERSIRQDRLKGAVRSERWDDAETVLHEILAETPRDPGALAQLAEVRERQRDFAGARDLYRRAIREAEWGHAGGTPVHVPRLRDALHRLEQQMLGVAPTAEDDAVAIDLATPLEAPKRAGAPRPAPPRPGAHTPPIDSDDDLFVELGAEDDAGDER